MLPAYDDKGKIFTQVVTKNPVGVLIQTTNHLIKGNVHVRPDERLKDEINENGRFFALTDAIIINAEGKTEHQCKFMLINQEHIIWIVPMTELDDKETSNE